jgi:hypothetical protein
MAYAHLNDLKILRDHAGEKDYQFTIEYFHNVLLQGAIFAVSDDECYFVVEAEGQYHAIIGEIRGEMTAGGPTGMFAGSHFAVNMIETFTYRDSAIACVLAIATNDSGGVDGLREMTRERAPWLKPTW